MDKKIVEELRYTYPKGTRIKLIEMDDNQAPPIGTLGTVIGVDDIGSIMVAWDNGSHLSLVYGVDSCIKLKDILIKQILTVRHTGLTNMFDTTAVQQIAFNMGLYELVEFIESDKNGYVDIILNG